MNVQITLPIFFHFIFFKWFFSKYNRKRIITKRIEYHDPNDDWRYWQGGLHLRETRPKGPDRENPCPY